MTATFPQGRDLQCTGSKDPHGTNPSSMDKDSTAAPAAPADDDTNATDTVNSGTEGPLVRGMATKSSFVETGQPSTRQIEDGTRRSSCGSLSQSVAVKPHQGPTPLRVNKLSIRIDDSPGNLCESVNDIAKIISIHSRNGSESFSFTHPEEPTHCTLIGAPRFDESEEPYPFVDVGTELPRKTLLFAGSVCTAINGVSWEFNALTLSSDGRPIPYEWWLGDETKADPDHVQSNDGWRYRLGERYPVLRTVMLRQDPKDLTKFEQVAETQIAKSPERYGVGQHAVFTFQGWARPATLVGKGQVETSISGNAVGV